MPDMNSLTDGTGIDTKPSITIYLDEFLNILESGGEAAVPDLSSAVPSVVAAGSGSFRRERMEGYEFPGGGGQRGFREDDPDGLLRLFGSLRSELQSELLPLLLQIAYIISKAGVLEGNRFHVEGLDQESQSQGGAPESPPVLSQGDPSSSASLISGEGLLGGSSIGEDMANLQAWKIPLFNPVGGGVSRIFL
jgi:hypothetical protein